LILSLTLSACLRQVHSTGHTLDAKKLERIVVEESNRNDVYVNLGSPSAKSEYGDEVWYYIFSEFEQLAFLKPKVIKQTIVAFSFDKEGYVSNVAHYDTSDAKQIELVKERTSTGGHELSILEQLLGNVGRFNATQ
jgi:outer membrane protein assembly factor BamE (lipoprotein component of BamABCDE complex)